MPKNFHSKNVDTKKILHLSKEMIEKIFSIGTIINNINKIKSQKNDIEANTEHHNQFKNKQSIWGKIAQEFWEGTKTLFNIVKTVAEIYGVLLFIIPITVLISQTPWIAGLAFGSVVLAYSGLFACKFLLNKIFKHKKQNVHPKQNILSKEKEITPKVNRIESRIEKIFEKHSPKDIKNFLINNKDSLYQTCSKKNIDFVERKQNPVKFKNSIKSKKFLRSKLYYTNLKNTGTHNINHSVNFEKTSNSNNKYRNSRYINKQESLSKNIDS